jgi:hypothetical protein
LLVSQFVTLYMTPTLYIYMENLADWSRGQVARLRGRAPLRATKA